MNGWMASWLGGWVRGQMDGWAPGVWLAGGSMGGPRNEKGMAGWVGSGGWTDRQINPYSLQLQTLNPKMPKPIKGPVTTSLETL